MPTEKGHAKVHKFLDISMMILSKTLPLYLAFLHENFALCGTIIVNLGLNLLSPKPLGRSGSSLDLTEIFKGATQGSVR